MNKLILITIALTAVLACVSEATPQSRYYAITCKRFECDTAFKSCSQEGCIGAMCDACVLRQFPGCGPCLEEFDKSYNFIPFGKYQYLLCDPKVPVQVDACDFTCRRNYQIEVNGSLCTNIAGYPVCQCAGWAPITPVTPGF